MNIEQIFREIQKLPSAERDKLIARLTKNVPGAPAEQQPVQATEGEPSLLGLFADAPDVVDEVCRMAMESRKRDKMRTWEYEHEESPA
jgi:hypothetical protein